MYKHIEKKSDEMLPRLIELRKAFHRYPEIAWQEHRTTQRIASILTDLGYEVIQGEEVSGRDTGVVGILECGQGPTIALRFDIDGLPVTESTKSTHAPNKENFSSEHEGYMHACGHDGHTTIGLGCAELLASMKSELKGRIRLIFQPAEEGARGAYPVTEKGWLDEVDYFLSGHVFQRLDNLASDCNLIPGVRSSLATTKMDVEFFGQSAHAAHPEQGRDTIAAMAEFICLCKDISSVDGFVQIGVIEGGTGRNIIADYGKIAMETRAKTTEIDIHLMDQIDGFLQRMEASRGITWKKNITGSAPSVMSSPEFSARLKTLYDNHVTSIHTAPGMVDFPASEDVSHMMERVKEQGGQAIFFLFPTQLAADLHKPDFDFPTDVLRIGVTTYVAAVWSLIGCDISESGER